VRRRSPIADQSARKLSVTAIVSPPSRRAPPTHRARRTAHISSRTQTEALEPETARAAMAPPRRPPRVAPLLAALLAVALAAAPAPAAAYEFDMVFQTKCVFEEVSAEGAIAGKFRAFLRDKPDAGVPLSLRVEDPHGAVVASAADVAAAEFTIKLSEEGDYKLCFTARDFHAAQSTRVALDWREGVDATDWEAVAKKDNLDAIQTELLRLEAAVHTIHLELQHVRRKEEEMRDVNGALGFWERGSEEGERFLGPLLGILFYFIVIYSTLTGPPFPAHARRGDQLARRLVLDRRADHMRLARGAPALEHAPLLHPEEAALGRSCSRRRAGKGEEARASSPWTETGARASEGERGRDTWASAIRPYVLHCCAMDTDLRPLGGESERVESFRQRALRRGAQQRAEAPAQKAAPPGEPPD
jgi:hypothetical protein